MKEAWQECSVINGIVECPDLINQIRLHYQKVRLFNIWVTI